MPTRYWTLDEIDDAHALSATEFLEKYPDRTFDALRIKRGRTQPSGYERSFVTDKVTSDFNWRDANKVIATMQDLKTTARLSQDTADIFIDTDKPICVFGLSDTHILSWGTDHTLFEQVTDEILNTDGLYVALLGDLEQMSIKLRGVLEVMDNMLPPELQHRYIESWLDEIKHKVLFATWDNHAVMREENASGYSRFADIMKRNVIYFNGIGHPNIRVGDQTYKFAVTHRFRGRSLYNPCHGSMMYLIREGYDREIAMAGDSHVPGLQIFTHGATTKMALNAGSIQTNSGYAKRFFSLSTHPEFPGAVLFPSEHRFAPVWNVQDWVKLRG
jgi:hypothetical protein